MRKMAFPLSCVIILVLGYFDYISGYEMSFSIFYLMPILLVAWFKSRPSAITVAFFSAAMWLWADLAAGRHYTHPLFPLWNAAMRFMVFSIVVFFAGGFKKELELQKKLSRIDALTELPNNRFFMEQAEIEIKRAGRFNRPFSLAYIDIDNFKKVNDSFGHNRGDDLLRLAARSIRDGIRAYDLAGRIGGDEFIILFPETNEAQVQAAVGRMQKIFAEKITKEADFITLSIGVAVYRKAAQSLREMIQTADSLMYAVKNNGKNNVNYKVIDS